MLSDRAAVTRAIALFSTTADDTRTEGAVEQPNPFTYDLPTNENSPALLGKRHTAAHIMAMAVQRLYPDAQVTIGPWIDNG
jgi:threonyl-tRNA synthetase